MDTMNRLSLLTAEFEGKLKVADWLVIDRDGFTD